MRPMTSATPPIAAAMKVNTPTSPEVLSRLAMTKPLITALMRLNE